MATIRRVTYLRARLKNKPGALLKVLSELKRKRLGLAGLWGFSTSGGKAELYVMANNTAKVRSHWRATRVLSGEGKGFWITGKNQTGALNRSLEALSKARVNIMAIDAIALGGRFGSFVWVSPGSVGRATRALKAR
jgi:hypothetical protein